MLNFMSKVKKEFLLTDIDANTSPDYPTERTGRCHKCNIRFIWPNSFGRLKDMTCPICGTAHLRYRPGPYHAFVQRPNHKNQSARHCNSS